MKDRLPIFISLLILSAANTVSAQNIKWNTAPKTGFVFQITNNEAQKLLSKSLPDTIINTMLHTQIDTFNVTKGWTQRPDKGHFILARIIENKLHCEYTSVFPYQVLLLKEYNALSLQVLDLEGNVREDAKVKFKMRKIHFDRESKTYRIENEWFTGTNKIATVELDGFRSVFNIEKHEVPSWANNYYGSDDGPDFYSYMITDKNKYKPGERVRFKSFALSGTRNPIRRDLEVMLLTQGKSIRLGKVSPHRPGSFTGEFHLHDSLKLTLDKHYSLQLWDKNGRVVSSCSFKYEDYELHGNKLFVDLETPRQFSPASNSIKIVVTTENGLILKDARASITVLTENIREVFQPLVVLPDTLMFKEIDLNTEDTTFVEIPSSLFQKSNTTYHVKVAVLNSQNQRMERSISASHYYSQYEMTSAFSNDSIVYQVFNNGEPMRSMDAKMFRDGATRPLDVILPYKEKINPATATTYVQTKLVSRTFRMGDMLPKIEFVGGIRKDSFNIAINNPQKIEVSWYVYQGSVLLEKGFGDEINYKSKIEDRTQTYYVELLYSFGGSDHITSRAFAFSEGSLDITLDLPDKVYPGQKVDALIEVTDEEGNAVSGVDLTALATTARLNYFLPNLPYYGTTSDPRSTKATYSKKDFNKRTAILDLDYDTWAPRARLDTMKYYQFTYPGGKSFVHTVSIGDSTQFAPFVMKDGIAQRIYIIEMNWEPVYYSWMNNPRGYSFYVEPGKKKKITLRLFDRVILLDSMTFERGKKTIFSLDVDHLPKDTYFHRISPQVVWANRKRKKPAWMFTPTEVNRLVNYIAAFKTSYPAYLVSGKKFVPVSAGGDDGRSILVGPVYPGSQIYTEDRHLTTTYRHEGNFSYTFENNIVYKLQPPKLFPDQLTNESFRPLPLLNDVFINKSILLQRQPYVPDRWYPRVIDLNDYSCRLKVFLPDEVAKSGVASLLFQDCVTGEMELPCRSYNKRSDYFTIPRGWRHVIVLYNNGTYLKMDSINLESFTNIVADMNSQTLRAADSSSREWLNIRGNCFRNYSAPPRTFALVGMREVIGNTRGVVMDGMNQPVPGVNIVVKGTVIGTITDAYGNFSLDIPADPSTLVISFIGFKSEEIEVRPGSEISVIMEEDVTQLSEVVVVGYGTQERREMTGSVSTMLQGKVAGITINEDADENSDPQKQREQDEREAEQRLYQELLTLTHIRSNFSDVGFWESRLFTDRHGRSKFSVTFPDDITRWDAVVFAMNSRLQTGTARKSIRSYKPLMAELHVPQFLTVGDTADVMGKVLNYTSDKTITGKTKWSGSASRENALTFDSYHTETFPLAVTNADTITTSYAFTGDDGYFDGEERKIPVVEQGTLRAKGTVGLLKNNDVVLVKSKKVEVLNLKITDNQLDLYAENIHYLVIYKYACNEQLASKLIGFLNYKLLMQYEGKPFKHDKDINKIIQRLLKNQNDEFLWSWWDVSPSTSHWMSAHILRALHAAKEAGYTVALDIENTTRKATYKYDFLHQLALGDIQIIHALALWDASIDYARYIKQLDAQIEHSDSVALARARKYGYPHYSSLNEKLLLMEVRQLQRLPFVTDSLLRYQKKTILSETYFTDGKAYRYWWADDLSDNAIAYRIAKRDSTLPDLIPGMQMYFLSKRRESEWNTYEAANVVMTILPDLIAQGATKKVPASVTLKGKMNMKVDKFPFNTTLMDGDELTLHKETGLPLYYMQYTEERVTKAHSGTDALKIKTTLDTKALKAGKPAIMKATIKVERDSRLEHVMIELPIPGGCSYADKSSIPIGALAEHRDTETGNRIETHREYFKEKTVIFCENMSEGTYVFQVQLLPRFTGKYFINPAQVSLMYIPVVNANTDMSKVRIE